MSDYLSVRKALYANLEELTNSSNRTGKKIYSNKMRGELCIIDTCHVDIDPSIAEILKKELTFQKTYRGRSPKSVADLIRFCGDIFLAVKELYALLDKREFQVFFDDGWCDFDNKDYSDDEIAYIDMLCLFLDTAKNKTSHKTSTEKQRVSFCSLCWRRPFSSRNYCKIHSPSSNKYNYKKTIRKLTSMTARYIKDEKIQLEIQQYKAGKNCGFMAAKWENWMTSFSISPQECINLLAIIHKKSNNSYVPPWQEYAGAIGSFTENSYPYAYSKIALIDIAQHKSYKEFVLSLIEQLSGESERNTWNWREDTSTWFNEGDLALSFTIITMISRYEAHHAVFSRPSEYGPQKGVGENKVMRSRIKDLYESNMQNEGKPRIADIAKQVGLSRQRVNKLCNEMKLRE